MLMMAANKAGWLYLEAFVDSLNKECCKESKYSGWILDKVVLWKVDGKGNWKKE